MTLRLYLDASGESIRAFARRAGVSHEAAARVARGDPAKSRAIALRIVAASGGKVSAAEALGLDLVPAPVAAES